MKMLESGPSLGTGHVGSNRGNAPEDFHGDPHEYLIIRGLGLRMVDWYLFMGGPMKSKESGQVAIPPHNKTRCLVNVDMFMRIPMKMLESGPSLGTGRVGSNRANAP